MGKFNTTTVMLLDEDIRLKMQNARILMQEDIENALRSTEYGWRILRELDYEQLHTIYEALKFEGYFKETED